VPFKVVIPARHGSSRLPGKPLLAIAGKPLIRHVYERACATGAEEVLVATDDARIAAACRAFGAEVAMTRTDHPSGTDRLAEVVAARGWPGAARPRWWSATPAGGSPPFSSVTWCGCVPGASAGR